MWLHSLGGHVKIAFFVSVSVLQPTVGLRAEEAFAGPLLAANARAKESQMVLSQEARELETSVAEVHEKLNGVSLAELSKVISDCDKEFEVLLTALKNSCEKYALHNNACSHYAATTLEHATAYRWQQSLVSSNIGRNVPVLWAGFSEFDTSGLASKKNLTDFVRAVNGILLHGGGQVAQTEWGQIVEEAKDLTSCPWDRKKGFWKVASRALAKAMRHAKNEKIVIAVRKELTGNYSLYKSILYQLELPNAGFEMFEHPEWTPTFEVHEIPVAESSDCTVAPLLKAQLEQYARRNINMTCSLCPRGLSACGSLRQVGKAEVTSSCTAGDCRNGRGNKTFADGSRYEGGFKNSTMDGHGKFFYVGGDEYEGDFKGGVMDGKGKYFFSNGNSYEGDYKNGMKDGKGKFVIANGDYYEGDFKKNRQDGKGTYVFFASGLRYVGFYKNGKKNFWGRWFYPDGDREKCLYEMGKQIRCK